MFELTRDDTLASAQVRTILAHYNNLVWRGCMLQDWDRVQAAERSQ